MKKCMFILAALLAFTGLIACGSSADNTAASPSAPSSGEELFRNFFSHGNSRCTVRSENILTS